MKKLEQWKAEDGGRGYLLVVLDKKSNLVSVSVETTKEQFMIALTGLQKSLEEETKGKGGHGQNSDRKQGVS